MRSAVFLPTPGMRTRRVDFAADDGPDQVGRGDAGEHLHGQGGADAADRDQLLKQRLFLRGEKTVERKRVFANVRVNAQADLGPGVRAGG